MKLEDLGYVQGLSDYLNSENLPDAAIARVTQEHREKYVVSDGEYEYEAEITGNLMYSASSRADFPAVGDWVIMSVYDKDKAIIYKVLPRRSVLARQAVGKHGEIQIISTNIDVAFIIQAINNNFNINRLERYLAACYSSGIEPVLVISKTDLATKEEIDSAINELNRRDSKVKHILLSNISLNGMDELMKFIVKGKTYCLVGSSGVGKSTLLNNLLKKEVMKTREISSSTNKGKHTTAHRQLFILENGGIIIDTPGMKELGMTDEVDGINATYDDIVRLAVSCRFQDCRHVNEAGCAVTEAVENGNISRASYDNYLRMLKEQQHFQTTVAEKKRRDKMFGKIVKDYFKNKDKNNY
jgi:ribosome biogenesis GTPase / thiamine phosphate phosphatase